MLIPRLHYTLSGSKVDDVIHQIEQITHIGGNCIQLKCSEKSNPLIVAQEAKKACLYYKIKLIVTDNLEVAEQVNSNGVILDFNDSYLHSVDFMDESRMIGLRVTSVDQIADLNDEGSIDFIILKQPEDIIINEDGNSLQPVRQILDDARIMGYNIPILIEGGIERRNAESILRIGAYGMIHNDLGNHQFLQEIFKVHGLK